MLNPASRPCFLFGITYLLLISLTPGTLSNELREDSHPITFTPVGQIIHSGSHYIIPLQLNIESLLSQINPLEKALTDTSNHYEQLRNIIGDGDRRNSTPLLNFPPSLRAHISLLIADLHQRMSNLKDLLITLADFGLSSAPDTLKLRTIRGAFDIIGSGLHYLFGIVDSATYDEAKQIIESLQDMSEKERNTLNLHSRILNTTAIHVERLEDNQKKATAAIISLDSNVRVLALALQNTEEQLFEVSNAINMISSISYASSAIADLTYEFSRFSKGLSAMIRGSLAPEILPSTNLASIINELNLHSHTRTLWPASAAYLPLYYKMAQVVPLNYQEFLFLVLIPLMPDSNSQMSLYRVSSLPYPVNTNVTISYGALSPYFAVSADHQLYTVMSDNDLAACRKFSSLHYCDHPRPLLKNTAPSCEYAFYTGINVGTVCHKHIGPKLSKPLFTRTPTRWLYATSDEFALTMVCPSGTRTLKIDVGVGAINLPKKCRGSSEYIVLPTTLSLERSETERINFTTVQPFHLEITDDENELVQHFSNDSLYKDILSLNGKAIPLSSLKNEIGQLRVIQRNRERAYQYSLSATWVSIILTIVISISCVVVFCSLQILRRYGGRVQRILGIVPTPNPPGDHHELNAPLTQRVD